MNMLLLFQGLYSPHGTLSQLKLHNHRVNTNAFPLLLQVTETLILDFNFIYNNKLLHALCNTYKCTYNSVLCFFRYTCWFLNRILLVYIYWILSFVLLFQPRSWNWRLQMLICINIQEKQFCITFYMKLRPYLCIVINMNLHINDPAFRSSSV